MTADLPAFPVDFWPGVPIEPVIVDSGPMEVSESGWLSWRFQTRIELPPEHVLRFAPQVDTDSRHDVVAYLSEFGPVAADIPVGDLPAAHAPDDRHGLRLVTHWLQAAYVIRSVQELVATWEGWWAEQLEQAGEPDSGLQVGGDIVRHDEALLGFSVSDDPLSVFAAVISDGMQRFTAHASYQGFPKRFRRIDLHAALCVQLHNLILEGERPKRCANDNCRRLFVRQVRDGRRGRRTEGVTYCTPRCADAQRKRDKRNEAT